MVDRESKEDRDNKDVKEETEASPDQRSSTRSPPRRDSCERPSRGARNSARPGTPFPPPPVSDMWQRRVQVALGRRVVHVPVDRFRREKSGECE